MVYLNGMKVMDYSYEKQKPMMPNGTQSYITESKGNWKPGKQSLDMCSTDVSTNRPVKGTKLFFTKGK